MSNSQSDERIKQMSKQEEILLRRKIEIQRKLRNTNTSQKNTSIKDRDTFSMSNKFNNDGSFFEQFKKISHSSNGNMDSKVKSEEIIDKEIPQSSSASIPYWLSNNFPVKEEHGEQKTVSMEEKQDIKKEEIDPSQSDWFQDALKRAKEKAKELTSSAVSLSEQDSDNIKKRRSRWGEKSQAAPSLHPVVIPAGVRQQTGFNMPIAVMGMVGEGQHMEAIQGVMITKLTRNNPAIITYAMKVFGTLDLTDAQWKQCEEQMKMNIVFQLLQEKKKETERLEMQGKVKYEYDSDEEIDGGTWEHKRRKKEMELTALKAEELTKSAEGKHHIGDFLPPEELSSFMEKYQALKEGRDPDLSDYRENRLTEDNIGYKMLKSMGWTEGTGLGAERKGITNPVNQKGKSETQGLGAGAVNNLSVDDDEYDAYRKRMMLAYRFRPNPLNNPRRAYY